MCFGRYSRAVASPRVKRSNTFPFFQAGKIKAEYKHEKAILNVDSNISASPVVNISASVGQGAYTLGYNTAFDAGQSLHLHPFFTPFTPFFTPPPAGKSALTTHNVALAYSAGDMVIHGTANDSKVVIIVIIPDYLT